MSIAPADCSRGYGPARLAQALAEAVGGLAGPAPPYCVALSGGLDSTALVTTLASLRDAGVVSSLRAVHVDHALHPDSARWSERCVATATGLGVECAVVRVDARPAPGESPESAARAARYAALARHMAEGEVLLTAHHADDQLETVLLQCLRGGGLRAVAGMPPVAPFGPGWHARPLLGFERRELEAWARQAAVPWLEDPSNADRRFDRNYLRLDVLPALRRRWPAAARTVGRVAGQAREALEVIAAGAERDLAAVRLGSTVSVPGLRALDPSRRAYVVRAWLERQDLPLPSAGTLAALLHDVIAAAPDRLPETRWPGAWVRRYRGRLYAGRAPDLPAWPPGEWQPSRSFDLGACGQLVLEPAVGAGLSRARITGPLRVSPRVDGLRIRPADSAHRRDLRKWLQERGVLPWRRAHLPIVHLGDEVIAVGDLAVARGFAAAPGEPSWRIEWRGRPVLTEAEAARA